MKHALGYARARLTRRCHRIDAHARRASSCFRACAALAAVAALGAAGPAWGGKQNPGAAGTAQAQPAGAQNPGIAPIYSRPAGKSYSQWAAAWWQWALQTPAQNHPALGGPCSTGQSGHVWFVGVNFSGDGVPLARSCTVPSGTALFVPLISSFASAFLNEPPEARTEEFLRSVAECSGFASRLVSIDGITVRDPQQYLERSVLFDVQLPVDNVFGLDATVVPELKLSPAVDFGYYLFVRPLAVGTHDIRWQVSMNCPSLGGPVAQDQTLSVTVLPRGR